MQHDYDMLHASARADETMLTTPLNVLDELYLHLDREQEAWSVHLEIRVEGRLDGERLAGAVRAAADRHPIARAQLASARATDVRYHWEIADELLDVDLQEIEADEVALDEARDRLLSRTPALDRPGPFALLLAHCDAGDVLVLNLHHAAGDGLSALRLMGSIARAYAGEEDPVPAIDPLEVRDVSAMAGAGSVKERLTRGRAALDYLARGVSAPTRIASQDGSESAGYGVQRTTFEPDEVERLLARRSAGATVNDVLLGGLAFAVHEWNERHDAPTGAIYLMMPINLRPAPWRLEVLGNFASYVSVRIGQGDHATLEAAIAAAAASTRRIKDGGVAGLIVDLFDAPTLLPTGLKQRMQDLIPLTGNVIVDTAVLSNLGRIESVPHLGDAGAVREVWFSPPGRMPLGASFGAATLDDRLFLTLRHRHPLFDGPAARDFLDTFKRGLLDGP
jgi:NRPS condensation-like uncharacterized protein